MVNLDDMNLSGVSDNTEEPVVSLDEAIKIDQGEGEDILPNKEAAATEGNASWLLQPDDIQYEAGTEDLQQKLNIYDAQAAGGRPAPGQPPLGRIVIRTNDGHNFRVYLSAEVALTPDVISILCRFFDTRTADDTVAIILGTGVGDTSAHAFSSIISAINDSQAKVIAIAAGMCSVAETMIWTFAKQRSIWKYGALTFGVFKQLDMVPELKPIYILFLQKAQELGYVTPEEAQAILDQGQDKFLLYEDLVKMQQ